MQTKVTQYVMQGEEYYHHLFVQHNAGLCICSGYISFIASISVLVIIFIHSICYTLSVMEYPLLYLFIYIFYVIFTGRTNKVSRCRFTTEGLLHVNDK